MVLNKKLCFELLSTFNNYLNYYYHELCEKNISKELFLHKKDLLVDSFSRIRLDLKNTGTFSNNLEIQCTNNDLNYFSPSWFTDEQGVGYQFETSMKSIFIKIKCINKGILKFYLKGIDYRDKNTNLKAYAIYQSLKINRKYVFNDTKMVWHNQPFLYEKPVENGEIISIEIKCNNIFDYFPELIDKINIIDEKSNISDNISELNSYCNSELTNISLQLENNKYLPKNKKSKIKNIALYGSCISRDPFTTFFNENYKEKYNCVFSIQRHSFISTMQKSFKINSSDLFIFPDNASNRFTSICIKEDIEKTFITNITKYDIDYLVIDVNFEIANGVICFNDNKYLTHIANIEYTYFFKQLKKVKHINMIDNTEEYFNLWKIYCDKFFEFMKTNCPNVKIILAEVRAVATIRKFDNEEYINHSFKETMKIYNPLYKKLEDYIKEKYDVYVINFDKNTVCNENHRWGKSFLHYTDEYYNNFINKMNQIVEFDELKMENIELKKRLNKIEKFLNNVDN